MIRATISQQRGIYILLIYRVYPQLSNRKCRPYKRKIATFNTSLKKWCSASLRKTSLQARLGCSSCRIKFCCCFRGAHSCCHSNVHLYVCTVVDRNYKYSFNKQANLAIIIPFPLSQKTPPFHSIPLPVYSLIHHRNQT
jgi:hypothetical protein